MSKRSVGHVAYATLCRGSKDGNSSLRNRWASTVGCVFLRKYVDSCRGLQKLPPGFEGRQPVPKLVFFLNEYFCGGKYHKFVYMGANFGRT